MVIYDRLKRSLTQDEPSWFYRNWELLVFFVGFVLLAWMSTSYELSARQFPFVFLAIGAIALAGELVVHMLPDQYAEKIRRMTSGLAADMDADDALDEEDEAAQTEAESAGHDEDESDLWNLAKALVPLGLFIVLSYLISFLIAIPVYVFSVFYLVGSKNYRNAFIISGFLMLATYFLFGEIMNVPIADGELVGTVF
ncbi:tripartite tricarboxylate transporter TctB family protein [Haloferax sp. DFSO52]|uniref:tripartite tricarboxylate transporter TctB family protein n=1 Tax=Haloferax sp. DFSO52 TaxID=3388505 RepID=UPI003A872AD1